MADTTVSLEDRTNSSVKILLDDRELTLGKLRFNDDNKMYYDCGVYMASRLLHYNLENSELSDRIVSEYLGVTNFRVNPELKDEADKMIAAISDWAKEKIKVDTTVMLLLEFRKSIPKKGRYRTGYKKLYDHGIRSLITSIMPLYNDTLFSKLLKTYDDEVAANN